MPVQVELQVLEDIHASWRQRAIALALPVKKMKDELAAAKAAGRPFTADEVGVILLQISVFYKATGGEAVAAEILAALGKPADIGATSLQTPAPPARPPEWRIS